MTKKAISAAYSEREIRRVSSQTRGSVRTDVSLLRRGARLPFKLSRVRRMAVASVSVVVVFRENVA